MSILDRKESLQRWPELMMVRKPFKANLGRFGPLQDPQMTNFLWKTWCQTIALYGSYKGIHPAPKSLFFYKAYKQPLTPRLVL